jgi:hypothetical protein
LTATEIAFRIAYEGPLTAFSAAHPRADVALWCDWKREVIEVSGVSEVDVAQLRRALAKWAPSIDAYPLRSDAHVLLMPCVDLPHDVVNRAVHDHQCMNLPPMHVRGGREAFRVVSFSDTRTRGLMRALSEAGRNVELVSKRELPVQSLLHTPSAGVGAVLAGLTEKQRTVLLAAFRHGLYDVPRRATGEAIARRIGMSRSTFDEHLRKAESRVFGNLVPHVELDLGR